MKNIWIIVAVVAIVAVAGFGAAGLVYAQSNTPPVQSGNNYPAGGMMGAGYGGHMGMMGGDADGDTRPMHDLMISAWAGKLGLTVDELNAKIDEGLTLAEIAEAQGVTGEAFTTAWTEVHIAVWDEAVAQGLLTADQAHFMKERMQARLDAGWVPGTAGAGCPMLDGDEDGQTGYRMGRGNRGGMMGGWRR